MSDEIYEDKKVYDGSGAPAGCGISSSNEGTDCEIQFILTEDINDDLMVYYELTNFYQNHRRYVGSRDSTQLMGTQVAESELELTCDPLYKNDTYILNPCGLIANSYFNDVINCVTHTMDETDISWETDREKKFIQVDGFTKQLKGSDPCPSGHEETTDADNAAWCYFYPDNDQYQYLYETYPQISPLDGVTDEHFIVWMRTAGLPNFRKLYGRINGPLAKGAVLTFTIEQNFWVSGFDGTKAITISTVGLFGGKNPFLGLAYIIVGSISLFFGALFTVKHIFFPRILGDLTKLHWS